MNIKYSSSSFPQESFLSLLAQPAILNLVLLLAAEHIGCDDIIVHDLDLLVVLAGREGRLDRHPVRDHLGRGGRVGLGGDYDRGAFELGDARLVVWFFEGFYLFLESYLRGIY